MTGIKISADRLAVGYTKPLINDISFDVRGGEILTLIGPNGSGKSTILKTLAGELKKMSGSIYIDGAEDSEMTPADRAKKISVLLTERINTELMTCREVVETGRYPYTGYFGKLTQNDREAVQEAMELTRISEFAECDFSEVSDGQRQRVMLARAICQEPEILILDEPTSYLDIHHKITFLETLRRLAREKQIALVMSMHELDFAREISDLTICIKGGGIFKTGNSAEVLSDSTVKELFDISDEMFKIYFKEKGSTKQ